MSKANPKETQYAAKMRNGHDYRAAKARAKMPAFTTAELKTEVWAPVPHGIVNGATLEASNLGRIRDAETKRVLVPHVNHCGYLIICPAGRRARPHTLAVAALVFAAWNPTIDRTGFDIDHADGDKMNCRPANLRLLDHRRNTSRHFRPVLHGGTVYPSLSHAANALGTCPGTIRHWIEEPSRLKRFPRMAGFTPEGEPIRYADEYAESADGLVVRV